MRNRPVGLVFKKINDRNQIFELAVVEYENKHQDGENYIKCGMDKKENQNEKVCRVEIQDLGDECTFQKEFGYDEGTPCVLLKLNKVRVILQNFITSTE